MLIPDTDFLLAQQPTMAELDLFRERLINIYYFPYAVKRGISCFLSKYVPELLKAKPYGRDLQEYMKRPRIWNSNSISPHILVQACSKHLLLEVFSVGNLTTDDCVLDTVGSLWSRLYQLHKHQAGIR